MTHRPESLKLALIGNSRSVLLSILMFSGTSFAEEALRKPNGLDIISGALSLHEIRIVGQLIVEGTESAFYRRPARFVTVRLVEKSGRVLGSVQSDEKGRFIFKLEAQQCSNYGGDASCYLEIDSPVYSGRKSVVVKYSGDTDVEIIVAPKNKSD